MARVKSLAEVNREGIEIIIAQRRIEEIYHCTHRDNLASIFKSGKLLCRRAITAYSIKVKSFQGWGGREKELADYVCLSFREPLWMMERLGEDWGGYCRRPCHTY